MSLKINLFIIPVYLVQFHILSLILWVSCNILIPKYQEIHANLLKSPACYYHYYEKPTKVNQHSTMTLLS